MMYDHLVAGVPEMAIKLKSLQKYPERSASMSPPLALVCHHPRSRWIHQADAKHSEYQPPLRAALQVLYPRLTSEATLW